MKTKKGGESTKDTEVDIEETYQDGGNELAGSGAIKQEQNSYENVDTSGVADEDSNEGMSLEQTDEYQQPVAESTAGENVSINETGKSEIEKTVTEVSESRKTDDEKTAIEVTEINENSEERLSGPEVESQKLDTANESESIENVDVNRSESTENVEVVSGNVTERLEDSSELLADKTDSLEATNKESSVEDSCRSSTFVVKTDVLSPTLSVSTVMPDTGNEGENNVVQQDNKNETEDVTLDESEMNVTENKEEKVINDGTEPAEKRNKDNDESGESFEDAVEEVN